MPTIEQRVVEMRFDNKQFEDNAEQSIETLDKLNESLDFKNGSKGLDKIKDAASKFKLTGIETAINSITQQFSALEIAGITAIQNITNQAMNWGTKTLKSFTIDPVTEGWNKYATKTQAVQTIMAATAKDIADEDERMAKVNEQMEKLNWFTDETSYSLVDMTSNIGKFTSNGIKLEDAVTQMEGISVWASISGASLNDASRAMYNLSQAMASGTVKTIDWMSIENANMATKEFKETAIQAAVELGTLKKTANGYTTAAGKAVDVTKDFKGTLSEGWFTSKVLSRTLNEYGAFTDALNAFEEKYNFDTASQAMKVIEDYKAGNAELSELTKIAEAGGVSVEELRKELDKLSSSEMDLGRRSFKAAQEAITFGQALEATKEAVTSGWMNTFEYIFGNYKEAKQLWTNLANELYDVFAGSSYDRNQILKQWHEGFKDTESGYKLLMESFSNIWTGIKNIRDVISAAWEAVFPSYDEYEEASRPLIELTEKFRDITAKFRDYLGELSTPIEEVVESIKNNPVTETVTTVAESLSVVEKTQEKLEELARRTRNIEFGNGEDRIKKIREMGYSYEVVQNEVNRQLEEEARARGENLSLIRHAIREEDKKKQKVETTTEVAKDYTEALKEQGIVEKKNADGTVEYVRTFHSAQSKADVLRYTLSNIFETIRLGKAIVSGIFKLGTTVISKIASMLEGPLWTAIEKVGDSFNFFFTTFEPVEKVEKFFDDLIPIVETALDLLGEFFVKIGNNQGVKRLLGSIDALKQSFMDIVGRVFDRLVKRKDAIDWALTFETVLNTLADAIGWISDKLAIAIEYIDSHKDAVIDFLKGIDDAVPVNLDNAAEDFKELLKTLEGFKGPVIDRIHFAIFKIGYILDKNINDPRSPLNNAIRNIKDMFGKLWEMMKGFDFGKLGEIAKGGGLAALGYLLFNFIKNLVDGMKNVAEIPEKLVDILEGIVGVLSGYQNKLNSEALLNAAKAIGIFVLSLIGLTLISEEDLNRVTATMIIIVGLVVAVMSALTKLNKSKSKKNDLAETIMQPIQNFLDSLKGTLAKLGKMIGMSALIVALAIGVGMIVKIINSLMDVPWSKFLSAVGMLVVSMGILVGGAILLSKFAENFNLSQAAGLIAFAYSIKILSGALEVIAGIEMMGLARSVGAIGLILLALSAAAYNAGNANMKGFGSSLKSMAIALTILIIPISAFAGMPIEKLIQGVGAVILLTAAVAGLAILLNNNAGAAKELNNLAVSLLILTVPMLIIGKAAKTAAIGLAIIAATMAVLLIAALVADKLAVGLETLAISFIQIGIGAAIFGVAATLIGVGALAIAKAIETVVKSFPLIIDGLIYLGKAVMEHGQELFVGFVTLLGLIAAAVIAASPGLAGSVVTLITTVGGAIVSSLPVLSGQAFALIMGLLMFVYSIAGPVVNTLLDIIVNTIHALADGLRNHAAPIFSAIGDILDACWDLIIEFIASVADMIPGVGGMVGDWIRGAKDWVQPTEEVGQELEAAAVNSVAGTGDAVNTAMNDEFKKIDVTSSATEAGENTAGTFGTSVETGFNSWLESSGMSGMIDKYKTQFTGGLNEANAQGGEEGVQAYLESFGVGLEGLDFSQYLTEPTAQASEAAAEAGREGGDKTGQEIMDSIRGKIEVLTPDIENAEVSAIDSADSAASTEIGNTASVTGAQMPAGIVKGILSGERSVYNAGWQLADAADQGYRDRSQTESPSKVAIRNGKFWDQGLALGIIRNTGIVSDAGKKSADTVMDTMRNIVGRISDAINGDMDLNPTITPVLDLSNIQNGTNAINGMLGGNRTFSLAAANSTAFEQNRMAQINRIEATSTNADVVAALGLLRGDVNNLNESMANTQVVLDSGQLVGATARKMDNALGRIKIYKGRGI